MELVAPPSQADDYLCDACCSAFIYRYREARRNRPHNTGAKNLSGLIWRDCGASVSSPLLLVRRVKSEAFGPISAPAESELSIRTAARWTPADVCPVPCSPSDVQITGVECLSSGGRSPRIAFAASLIATCAGLVHPER